MDLTQKESEPVSPSYSELCRQASEATKAYFAEANAVLDCQLSWIQALTARLAAQRSAQPGELIESAPKTSG